MKYETLITLVKARVHHSNVRVVAKKAKVSPSTISRIQRGGVPDLPSQDTFGR
jgi:transcriptional regulator with XRE-family HTH domain